jgi:hypothetical protein
VVELPGTRRVSRLAPYGAPPRQVEHIGLNERTLTLLHTIEELKFRDELFRIFRQWDNYVPQQDRFKDEIARQGAQFVARMDNLDVAVVVSFLANGIAWFDGDNNLLPSSSGAKLTVDQLVPANNKNQLNGLIAASWATTSTDIVGQITAIKNQSVINTGYRLKYAFYGVNIPGYFAKNDSIKGLWQFNQASNANYQNTGRMPPEMLELMWIPAYPSFFEDQAGTTQNLFPADGVTFFPEIDRMTYTYLRGSPTRCRRGSRGAAAPRTSCPTSPTCTAASGTPTRRSTRRASWTRWATPSCPGSRCPMRSFCAIPHRS